MTVTLSNLAKEVQSDAGSVNIHILPMAFEGLAIALIVDLLPRDEPFHIISPTNIKSNIISSAKVSPIGSLNVVEFKSAIPTLSIGQPPPPSQASFHLTIVFPSISLHVNVIQNQASLHLVMVSPSASQHINVTQD